ncbi:glycosyltransferase family 2 protein [Conexibacter sp. DBS9H8]|uniref:glycosyltransferase family 2 protein n=1 Tax=Conexibacter sp. DBS9H8 TaxID=2937801 RepID=UPI0020108B14|nr:hypothetical protein [Conexibacter sp. DBS9H8]
MAWLEDGPQNDFKALDAGAGLTENHWYGTGISYARDAYIAAGGMDETLTFGYEDAEFGRRLRQQGVRLVYRPELMLIHHHPYSMTTWRQRSERVGAAAAAMHCNRPSEPRLSPLATGPLWLALAAADSLLQASGRDWASAPDGVRRRIYGVSHLGAYARGYRRALRSIPPTPPLTQSRSRVS